MIAGVVLAGGAGRRMGGVDKAALEAGGVPLLDRVLAAARSVCDRLVVVGPVRPVSVDGVVFVSEPEPGGGPVPAVQAGVDAAPDCDVVVVLAVDLPLLRDDHVARLVAALDGEAVAAADDLFGPNPLLAAYRAAGLRDRLAGLGAGTAAQRLLPLSGTVVTVDLGAGTLNVNRPADLAAARFLVALDDPPAVETAVWLRDLVVASLPDCEESVAPSRGFDYRDEEDRPVCSILADASGVGLSVLGAGEPRFVPVRARDDPPAALLAEALAEHRRAVP